MDKSRSLFRPSVLGLFLVFIFSFLTVEIYTHSGHPWLQLPGFMESDMEFGLPASPTTVVQANNVTGYRRWNPPVRPAGRTEHLFNIYRAPPL